jgi:hypothetical protein
LLKNSLIFRSKVLYDKPNHEIFHPITLQETHELFKRMKLLNEKRETFEEETLFTEKKGDEVVFKKDRPLLLVSSTSWTKDEVKYIKDCTLFRIIIPFF